MSMNCDEVKPQWWSGKRNRPNVVTSLRLEFHETSTEIEGDTRVLKQSNANLIPTVGLLYNDYCRAAHDYNIFHHEAMATEMLKENKSSYEFQDVSYKPNLPVPMINASPKLMGKCHVLLHLTTKHPVSQRPCLPTVALFVSTPSAIVSVCVFDPLMATLWPNTCCSCANETLRYFITIRRGI